MIEVEKLALLPDKASHDQLITQLSSLGAKDLGENNTESIFYLGGTFHLKVCKQTSKHTAKLALKQSEYGDEFSQEYELPISFDDAATAEKMMNIVLSKLPKVPTAQTRHDFLLDGVEIAVKHSDDWGYHVELEKLVEKDDQIEAALTEIAKVAKSLQLVTLAKEEAKAHIEARLAEKGIG